MGTSPERFSWSEPVNLEKTEMEWGEKNPKGMLYVVGVELNVRDTVDCQSHYV